MKILILLLLSVNIYANEFMEFFDRVNSLEADFSQEIDGKTTTGKFYFQRPKSLKWHTLKPDEEVLLLHNNKITKYDVWLQSANIIDYKTNDLIEYFTTRVENLKVIPKLIGSENGINYYDAKNILFGFKNGTLKGIVALTSLDKEIIVNFDNLIINHNLSKEFYIDFSDDVDIME